MNTLDTTLGTSAMTVLEAIASLAGIIVKDAEVNRRSIERTSYSMPCGEVIHCDTVRVSVGYVRLLGEALRDLADAEDREQAALVKHGFCPHYFSQEFLAGKASEQSQPGTIPPTNFYDRNCNENGRDSRPPDPVPGGDSRNAISRRAHSD